MMPSFRSSAPNETQGSACAVVRIHNHVLRRWLRGLMRDPEAEFDGSMADILDLFTMPKATTGNAVVVFQPIGTSIPACRVFAAW